MVSPDIGDEKILSGIANTILSPSRLRLVVNRAHKAMLMKIAEIVCKYPCSIVCDKVKRATIGRMVKNTTFRDEGDEPVVSIRFDADASKGFSEKVTRALNVSLK